jgi:hypothetical protein
MRPMNPETVHCALSRARPEHLRLLLTTDLHGCRQSGSFALGAGCYRFEGDTGGCGGQKRVGKPEIPLANAASKPIPQDLTSVAERAGMWTPERRFAGVR